MVPLKQLQKLLELDIDIFSVIYTCLSQQKQSAGLYLKNRRYNYLFEKVIIALSLRRPGQRETITQRRPGRREVYETSDSLAFCAK